MADALRLLFTSRSLPFHHVGGMEAVAWDLSRALARRGHEVEILTTSCPALQSMQEIEGVRIRTINARSGRYSARYWAETVRLFETDYRGRIDTVLGVGMGAHAIARRRRPGSDPKLIMQSHGQPWGEFISKLSVPKPVSWLKSAKNLVELSRERVLRHYDHIVAVGPAVEQVLQAAPTRWMRGDTPTSVIANGIDEERFRFDPAARREMRDALGIPAEAPVMISACRLHPQKGLREALQGFAEASRSRKDLHYVIVGTGPAETELRAQVSKLGIEQAVHFTRAVRRELLPRYLSASDAFVFTSKRQEGLALGPLEAAATGLPTILSTHLTISGLESSAVDPGSPAQIAAAILSCAKSDTAPRRSRLPYDYSLKRATDCYELVIGRSTPSTEARSHPLGKEKTA